MHEEKSRESGRRSRKTRVGRYGLVTRVKVQPRQSRENGSAPLLRSRYSARFIWRRLLPLKRPSGSPVDFRMVVRSLSHDLGGPPGACRPVLGGRLLVSGAGPESPVRKGVRERSGCPGLCEACPAPFSPPHHHTVHLRPLFITTSTSRAKVEVQRAGRPIEGLLLSFEAEKASIANVIRCSGKMQGSTGEWP
ncbi:hypothetical protein CRG98_015093 [Punica granatum]|uniref:Uncharacterized protein n=1 Tax=Punica granatum TaxID=22663 RepID=A0A2I0K8L2_PUNGR|nr:hypothetical protein CRG98_015093 [Punica granatum]